MIIRGEMPDGRHRKTFWMHVQSYKVFAERIDFVFILKDGSTGDGTHPRQFDMFVQGLTGHIIEVIPAVELTNRDLRRLEARRPELCE